MYWLKFEQTSEEEEQLSGLYSTGSPSSEVMVAYICQQRQTGVSLAERSELAWVARQEER